MRNCDTKLRFSDLSSATAAADSYNSRIAIKFSPLGVYFCRRHGCLHIGHSSRPGESLKQAADLRSVHRHMLRESIKCDRAVLIVLETKII